MTRNKTRAATTFALAFADHHFQESEDVFLAEWRVQSVEMLMLAMGHRDRLQKRMLKEEQSMSGPQNKAMEYLAKHPNTGTAAPLRRPYSKVVLSNPD